MSRAILTVDLGYGDCGKGTVVDYLTSITKAQTVVRYNGGAQAAHNVVTNDGRQHVFSQFGSGTFRGAKTHLSPYMLVNPLALWEEADELEKLGVVDPLGLITIAQGSLITTPFHRATNRIKELSRRDSRHGSCGMGIGETQQDFVFNGDLVLFAGDLNSPRSMREKLESLKERKQKELKALMEEPTDAMKKEYDLIFNDPDLVTTLIEVYGLLTRKVLLVDSTYLASQLVGDSTVIFEGSQGVLLDEWRGFHPYTTWSTTTLANADFLLKWVGFSGEVSRIGILRSYQTRHGPGPLVTEDYRLTQSMPDRYNTFGAWQGGFRVGHLDLVATQYAAQVAGRLDGLAITHLDRIDEQPNWLVSRSYHAPGLEDTQKYFETLGDTITGIKPGPFMDLEYQEGLTNALMDNCKPSLETVSPNQSTGSKAQALVEIVEQTLNIPVILTSSGPTAEDKTLIGSGYERFSEKASEKAGILMTMK